MNPPANSAESKRPKLSIKIIKERIVEPTVIRLPNQNADFKQIQQPKKQLAKIEEDALMVFIHEKAQEHMWTHVRKENKNEVGGALLGIYAKDEETNKEFVIITDVFNQPLEYSSDPTEIRFTITFYNELGKYLDQIKPINPNVRQLGLYHTHPGYGIFMSRTDKKVFQSSFKEKWQIALIADPITGEDGVFIWHNHRISEKVGYQTYQTDNLRYQLHYAQTTNLQIANYNSHIQLRREPIPMAAPSNTYAKNTPFTGVQQRPKTSLKNTAPIKINKTHLGREQLKIKPLTYLPKPYPLVSFKYKCTEVKLIKYRQPMRTYVELLAYPLEIFIKQSVNDKLKTLAMQEEESIVLLQGQACFDKRTHKHFVEIIDILHSPKPINKMPFHYLSELLKSKKANNSQEIIGWCYLKKQFSTTLYPFFETHQQLFSRNTNLGFLLSPNEQGDLNWKGATLIAQDYKKNEPYEYFNHLFLYEKRY